MDVLSLLRRVEEKKKNVMDIASSIEARATVIGIFFVLIGILSVMAAVAISSYFAKNMITSINLAGEFANKVGLGIISERTNIRSKDII